MSKIKSLCGKCSNNCKEGFTIFSSEEDTKKLTDKFSFYKVLKSGIGIVGKSKKEYQLMKCDRLMDDGGCESFPENAPAWCKIKA